MRAQPAARVSGRATRMGASVALALLLISVTTGVSASKAMKVSSPVVVRSTSHSVQLSIRLNRVMYPRSSLVDVSARIDNHGSLPIVDELSSCSGLPGEAQVVGPRGQNVYPPVFKSEPPETACTGPGYLPIQPGSSYSWHQFVILRGGRVREEATVKVRVDPSSSSVQEVGLSTPFARVQLTVSQKPRLVIHTSPVVYAILRGLATPATGSVRYVDWYRCPNESGWRGTGATWETAVAGPRLEPGCPQPSEWHVIAGVPGQPVAHGDYTRPVT